MSGSRTQLTAYALLVFTTSALVLVVEIVAARLIAPFVGVSLYSWTAIIGVVLAGLSLGNWLGGVWADRGAGERAAGITLLLASASVFAVLLILPRLGAPLQDAALGLAGLSLVMAGTLFFVPAALLGVLTPLLTTLALKLSSRTGHIVGLMHALAALGSILGTFITGFWLVQWFGSRNIIVGTGVLLLLLAVPLLGWRKGVVGATAAALIGAASMSTLGYATPCERESSYFCLRVVDSSGEAPFGEARSLILDHLLHGSNHREEPQLILAPYLHLMDELAAWHTADRSDASYFFAGGGAYTLPRSVRARDPRAEIVVAEIDPVVTDLAAQRLFVNPAQFEIRHTDARVALRADAGRRYDVIVGDVFHDIAIPYHLVTREFAALVRERLRPDGIYLLNVVDAFPDARFVKAKVKTLQQEFGEVQVWLEELPEAPARVTYVISARNGGPDLPELYSAKRGMPRQWEPVTASLLDLGTPLERIPALSDDLAPVERLLAGLFLGQTGR
jgi:MFS family permease